MADASGASYLPSGRAGEGATGQPDGQFQGSSQVLGRDQYRLAQLLSICLYRAASPLTVLSRNVPQ